MSTVVVVTVVVVMVVAVVRSTGKTMVQASVPDPIAERAPKPTLHRRASLVSQS
jgi:hypothetical protein